MVTDRKTLLVVDDNTLVREVISDGLRNATDFQVYNASNGIEALKLMEERHFDCLLTDYNMSLLNGVELIRNINKRNKPELIIGMSSEDRKMEFLNAGADSFFLKPFSFILLTKYIHAIQMNSRVVPSPG